MLTVRSAATVASAVSILGLSGIAAAAASPVAGPTQARTEHIQIMSTSAGPAAASAIASGAFTAGGRAELGSAPVGIYENLG